MRPDLHPDSAPSQVEVGMVSLLLGEGSDCIHVSECVGEVPELVELREMVLIDDLPALIELGAGFHPEFTGRDNIFMNASILGFSRKEIKEKYCEIVEFSELGHFIEHPVKTYGGWGIRKGSDGTFALTQAFIKEAIKLETIDQTFVISSRKAEDWCKVIKKARG